MIQLNKILKSFKKTIDQLEQLTATNNIEVSRNTELIAEAQAAKETAENLKALINPLTTSEHS